MISRADPSEAPASSSPSAPSVSRVSRDGFSEAVALGRLKSKSDILRCAVGVVLGLGAVWSVWCAVVFLGDSCGGVLVGFLDVSCGTQ